MYYTCIHILHCCVIFRYKVNNQLTKTEMKFVNWLSHVAFVYKNYCLAFFFLSFFPYLI